MIDAVRLVQGASLTLNFLRSHFRLPLEPESCLYLHEYAQTSNYNRSIFKEEYDIVMLTSRMTPAGDAELDRKSVTSVRASHHSFRYSCQ